MYFSKNNVREYCTLYAKFLQVTKIKPILFGEGYKFDQYDFESE